MESRIEMQPGGLHGHMPLPSDDTRGEESVDGPPNPDRIFSRKSPFKGGINFQPLAVPAALA